MLKTFFTNKFQTFWLKITIFLCMRDCVCVRMPLKPKLLYILFIKETKRDLCIVWVVQHNTHRTLYLPHKFFDNNAIHRLVVFKQGTVSDSLAHRCQCALITIFLSNYKWKRNFLTILRVHHTHNILTRNRFDFLFLHLK